MERELSEKENIINLLKGELAELEDEMQEGKRRVESLMQENDQLAEKA